MAKNMKLASSAAPVLARNTAIMSWWELEVLRRAESFGGFYNAHAHLDRAGTLEDVYLRHIDTTPLDASILPLSVKQNLVGDLHDRKRGLAYKEDDLRARLRRNLDLQIAFGVTRIDTNIDATPDLPENGMLAMRIAEEVAKEYADRIKVRIAPTPIFGFKYDPKDKPTRWEVFAKACAKADYISALPEKDDFKRGFDRENPMLDFKNHIRKTLEIACELKKEVQFHLDQANIPSENGTERLLEVLEVIEMPIVADNGGAPTVWVIHMISPSSYDEVRFRRLVDGLLRYNVGVIVCPSAALSMRQLRAVNSPTHNSIARVLELIKARVPIRIGTDNIFDVFVPQGDGDMLTEIKMGGVALRLNSPSIWAKLATGTRLTNVDINTVGRMLHEERKANRAVSSNGWEPAIE